MPSTGKFIAFVGMMGTGKSTLAKQLAQQLNAQVFIEPEADHWPVPADEPWENHVYALENWVRNISHEHFVKARAESDNGALTVSDGGFFLINRNLIGDACCDWYFRHLSPKDYDNLRTQAATDWQTAPLPDALILLEASKSTWLDFLKARGRHMDANAEMINHYEAIQQLIAKAATEYAADHHIPIIRHTNTIADPAIICPNPTTFPAHHTNSSDSLAQHANTITSLTHNTKALLQSLTINNIITIKD